MISHQNGPSGLLRPFSSEFSALNRVLDALIIWGTLKLSCFIFQIQEQDAYQYAALLGIIFYFFFAEIRSLYRSSRLQSYGSIASKIFSTWAMVGFFLILLAFATKSSATFSRLAIVFWLLVTPLLLGLERLCIYLTLRKLRSKGSNSRSYAILGGKDSAAQLLSKMDSQSWTGLSHFQSYENLSQLLHDVKAYKIDMFF